MPATENALRLAAVIDRSLAAANKVIRALSFLPPADCFARDGGVISFMNILHSRSRTPAITRAPGASVGITHPSYLRVACIALFGITSCDMWTTCRRLQAYGPLHVGPRLNCDHKTTRSLT